MKKSNCNNVAFMIGFLAMKAEEILKRNGIKLTKGRVRILEILLAAKRPLSQKEILMKASAGNGHRPDRVSVYRILSALNKADIIHKAYLEGRRVFFEPADRCGLHHCHPHFSCRACGATTCMEDLRVSFKGPLKKGYLAERQKLLIEGLCPNCR